MAKTKVKDAAIPVTSWDDADMKLSRIAQLKSRVDMETAKYNEREQREREKMTEAHAPLRAEIEGIGLGLKHFAETNRADFGDRQSKELQHGVLLFRKGTPKVDKVKQFTWDAILLLAKKLGKKVEQFIRTKEELNKEAVLENAALWEQSEGKKGIDPTYLQTELGLSVIQEETFGYETNLAAN